MLSKILTPVVLIVLLGCEAKEYKKNNNSSIDIVSELNQKKSKTVINKLEDNGSLSNRDRYYLASAYSMEGGIDVYSLYPILEIQLFRKNSLEWSNLSKEKNPYLKFLKSQKDDNNDKLSKLRQERWEKYEPKIVRKLNLKTELPSSDELSSFDSNNPIDPDEYELVKSTCANESALVKKAETFEDFDNRLIQFQGEYQNKFSSPYTQICDYYADTLILEMKKRKYLNLFKDESFFSSNTRWEMIYMNILWNTYEAIPMMKQLPTLSDDQQNYITKSLENYKITLSDPEFRDVSLKNITLLTGISLLSIYKESFNLDEIDSFQDIFCTFQPETITENYSLIRKRLLFFTKLKEISSEIPDFEKYKHHIDSFNQTMPEDLSQEEKEQFIRGVEESKLNGCFST